MATKQVVSIAPRDNLFFILGGFTYSKALFLINKLNVAGQLAGGEKSINELSKRLNANPDALHRLMRMLASVNIFEEVAEGAFLIMHLHVF